LTGAVTRGECLKLGAALALAALLGALSVEGTEGAQSAGWRYLDEVLALLNRLQKQWKVIRSAGESTPDSKKICWLRTCACCGMHYRWFPPADEADPVGPMNC